MKAIKCDACGKFVNVSMGATVRFTPNNTRHRWDCKNGILQDDICIDEEEFDLCRECAILSLRKYYGKDLNMKGVNV